MRQQIRSGDLFAQRIIRYCSQINKPAIDNQQTESRNSSSKKGYRSLPMAFSIAFVRYRLMIIPANITEASTSSVW